jgi:ankyrin repeat protein
MGWLRKRSLLACFALWACGATCAPGNAQVNDLIDAAGNGEMSRVQALLTAHADVNAKSYGAVTALMRASQNGHLDVVQALLAAHADVNAKMYIGFTALMWASITGHGDVVQALLAAHADVNAKSDGGITVLMIASQNGHVDVVRALLAAHADVNAKSDYGDTALMMASQFGHGGALQALLAAHADVNARNRDGDTALMKASQNGHVDVVRALLATNADVNAKADNGDTALMIASEFGHGDAVQALLTAKVDVNARNKAGDTALMKASQNGHVDVVRALLATNADVNAKAGNGDTALMIASRKGHADVVQLLKSAGAVTSFAQKETPPTQTKPEFQAAEEPTPTAAQVAAALDGLTLDPAERDILIRLFSDSTFRKAQTLVPVLKSDQEGELQDGDVVRCTFEPASESVRSKFPGAVVAYFDAKGDQMRASGFQKLSGLSILRFSGTVAFPFTGRSSSLFNSYVGRDEEWAKSGRRSSILLESISTAPDMATFKGVPGDPLSFVLLPEGLVYLHGTGTVTYHGSTTSLGTVPRSDKVPPK